jgi:hypothetical protein
MIHDSHKDSLSLSLSRTPKYFFSFSFPFYAFRSPEISYVIRSRHLPPRLLGGNNRIIHVFIYSTAMCVYLLHVRTPYIIYYYPPSFFLFHFLVFFAVPPFWPLPFLCSVPYTNEMNLIQQRHLIFIVGRLLFSLCCIIPCRRPFL